MSDPTYAVAGATLAAFHASDAFVRAIIGPFAGGKTSACCVEIMRRANEQKPGPDGVRRSKWVIVRQTYRMLSTTTIPSWREWFGDNLGGFAWSEPPTHSLNFRLPDGTTVDAEVQFLALDGADAETKLRGLQVTGGWLNEVKEIPKGVVDFLLGRLGRFPSKKDGGCAWSGLIVDTNPPDSDHWLFKLAEETKPEGWAIFKQPGGVIRDGNRWVENPNAENLANLQAGYYLRQIAGQSDDWIRVYLGGEYGFVADGRPVFTEYRDSVHCALEALAPVEAWPLVIGVDFGLTPAAVFAQRSPRGQWHILDELVADDMGIARFGELLGARLSAWYSGIDHVVVWGDPAGAARSQNDERSALDVLQAQLDVPCRPAPTNAVTARLEAVRGTLNRLVDGKPGLLISPACVRLRKALAGGYCFRRVQVSGERYEDKPDKNEFSHVADALQYALCGGGEYRATLRRDRLARTPEVVRDWNEHRW